MAVPRNRHSNSRKNNKRSHHAHTQTQKATCQNCKAAILPHRVCDSCGHYKGKSFVAKQL